MVEQPKYLEMTLSQLKAYVESSESKVLLVVELLDHIIVGGTNGKMLSFREEKMLNVTGRMDRER